MEASGTTKVVPQDQGQVKAGLKADATLVPGAKSVSLWKTFKQVCGAGPGIDSFDASSFDQDAKAIDDDPASSSSSSSSCSPEDGLIGTKAVVER